MKSAVVACILLALPLFATAGPSQHGKSLLNFRSHHNDHKRHAAAFAKTERALKSSGGFIKRKRLPSLNSRKVPGTGDSTTAPSNIATDTYTAAQGCAVWHTVSDGEVCLGLIDKSSSNFTIDTFHTYNPSVNTDCTNLVTGDAYCVDTTTSGVSASASASSTKSAAKTASAKNLLASASVSAQADADEDDDCEDDEDEDSDDDEDCDDDDDSEDTVSSTSAFAVKVKAQKTKAATSSTPAYTPKTTSTAAAYTPATTNTWTSVYSPEAETTSQYVAPTTTSQYVAPTTTSQWQADTTNQWQQGTTSEWQADTTSEWQADTTSEWQADTTTSSYKAAATTSDSSSGSSGSYDYTSQQGTYYLQNGVAGSCGTVNSDSAMIVAVKSDIMSSSLCGKTVSLKNTATGVTAQATVADTCPTCVGMGMDMSQGLFEALSGNDLGLGVLTIDYTIG